MRALSNKDCLIGLLVALVAAFACLGLGVLCGRADGRLIEGSWCVVGAAALAPLLGIVGFAVGAIGSMHRRGRAGARHGVR